MPGTMLTKFCHKQNLRNLFTQSALPPALHDIIPKFLSTFHNDIRGTLNSVINAGFSSPPHHISSNGSATKSLNERVLKEDVFLAMQKLIDSPSPYADEVLKSVEHEGYTYVAGGQGDSNVVFDCADRIHTRQRSPGFMTRQTARAGSIREIFRYRCGPETSQVFLVIEEYEPLPAQYESLDPYAKFDAGGFLFQSTHRTDPMVTTLSSIVCHFAMRPRHIEGIPGDLIHVLPLNKVCPNYMILIFLSRQELNRLTYPAVVISLLNSFGGLLLLELCSIGPRLYHIM